MSIFEASHSRWTPRMLSLFRVVVAILFIEHGTQKLFGFPSSAGPAMAFHALSLTGFAGMLESLGGFAILLGLFTRPVAFVLCGEMAVAYFRVHWPRSVFPIQNSGDTAVLFCFIFLYFVFAGAGPWSADAIIAESQRDRAARPSS